MSSSPTHRETSPALRIRARGRSFLALVLSPEAPLEHWLDGLDHQIARSGNLFSGKPILLDLDLLSGDTPGLADLLDALSERQVRIIGIEGGDRSWPAVAHWAWPAPLDGGKPSGTVELPDTDSDMTAPPTLARPSGHTLILHEPVRSGQRIQHLDGDIVILGTVASGAEIVAAGSIHVYGALRGRAIAGINEQGNARIFTQRLEAELLAIDGYYAVADEIDATKIGQPAQAFLSDDRITISTLPR